MESPTALQQGNNALRSGQYAEAVRHYALGLITSAPPESPAPPAGPISQQLAHNLLLARKRYRRERHASGSLRVAVACWSLSENPLGRAHVLVSLYQALADEENGENNGDGPGFRGGHAGQGRAAEPNTDTACQVADPPSIDSVALIGTYFARRGRTLWPPLRAQFEPAPETTSAQEPGPKPAPQPAPDQEPDQRVQPAPIPVHSVLVEDDSQFMSRAIGLVSAHPFDLVHISKPRFPNIVIALLYRLLWDAQILVDIDDDELAFVNGQPLPETGPNRDSTDGPVPVHPGEQALAHWLQRYNGLPSTRDLLGRPWTEFGMSLASAFAGPGQARDAALSVANGAFQQRHGGTLIRHARDLRLFQPKPSGHPQSIVERRARSRAHLNIRPEQQVVIYLGTPRRHKGLLETAQALAALNRSRQAAPRDLLYLIVGRFPPGTEALKQGLDALHASGALAIRLLDDQPFAEIPDLLAAADLSVLLQDPDAAAARAQTPAKLSDALAMGLRVLAEVTPGLADLAEQGAVIPVTRETLAATLSETLAALAQRTEPTGPQQPAPQPHPVFTRELSLEVNRERLRALLSTQQRPQPHSSATAVAQPLTAASTQPRAPSLARPLQRLAVLPSLGPLPRALLAASLSADPAARDGVSVIILSLRGAELLERLLSSFFANNSHQPVELIIVDHGDPNDADDRTAAVLVRVQAQHRTDHRSGPDLWHLPRERNHSFSDSCNLAAALARYPNLLFLNNDIVYSADPLPTALQRLQDHSIGAVGIRLDDDPDSLPPGQTPSVQHLGIEFVWNEQRGYHQPSQIRHPDARAYDAEQQAKGHQPPGRRTESRPQPAVTGAFLLCRRDDFERLGGFSTDYDYGLEDIDLCLRLQRDLGKRSECLTGLALQHAESSTRRRDRTSTNAKIANNHRIFAQHWSQWTASWTHQHSARRA
ncbi:glycosyltransferase [Lamprobacter modestohalophilus]|uniref:glycosyltransferase n=1 Tax=Lamprobacter modestohalophilus TaxID=1064514 RepID=UPI002ADEBC34|nr:glycosyltransferase [Lamprobacter modestohalophilus]MEA1051639.1 glycosyltransferase [Lamprobacter modestohalophilus]